MNELLDDDFRLEGYKAALTEEERALLSGKIPYLILRGDVLAAVLEVLAAAEIDFKVQRQHHHASTNGTGIVPLASTQLDLVESLIYISAKDKAKADQLVADYEANKQLETPKKETGNFKFFYIGALLFLLYLLWKMYRLSFGAVG
jgi:hypothetical protein